MMAIAHVSINHGKSCMQFAKMETSDSSEVLISMRDVWKFVIIMESGELCVMTSGMPWMLRLSAGSLDTQNQVSLSLWLLFHE